MEVSSSDLKAFREVVRVRSVSRAAERLHLTQPAVSAIVKKMEHSLGVTLLVRTGKGVHPTRAGERLYAQAQALIQGWENLRAGVLEDQEEMQGSYRIGAQSSVAAILAPKFATKILEQHSKLELRFVHDLSRNVADAILNFQIDFGLVVNPPKHPDLVIRKLYTANFGFWAKKKAPPSLQDPSKETSVIVCHPELAQSQTLLAAARKRNGLKSSRFLHSSDLQVLVSLTAAGAGIGILPEALVMHTHPRDLVNLPGFPIEKDLVALVYRRDLQDSKAARFIKSCIEASLTPNSPVENSPED